VQLYLGLYSRISYELSEVNITMVVTVVKCCLCAFGDSSGRWLAAVTRKCFGTFVMSETNANQWNERMTSSQYG